MPILRRPPKSDEERQLRRKLVEAAIRARTDDEAGTFVARGNILERKAAAERSLHSFVELMWPEIDAAHPFIDGWAITAICEHLEAVARGQIRRIIFNVPPGFSKSTLMSILYPAWEWGPLNRPWKRFITASHTVTLTTDFNRRCRDLIQSDLYQRLWGDRFQLSGDQNAKVHYHNDHGGFRLAASTQADLRFRADVCQLDDPNPTRDSDSEAKNKAIRQFVGEVWPSRHTNPQTSVFMLIQQRVSENDVTDFFLRNELGYEHLCIPMRYERDHPTPSKTSLHWTDPRTTEGELAWPERFDEVSVNKEAAELSAYGGDYAVAGQHQQRPIPRGGGLFQSGKLGSVDVEPEYERAARGWDLAASREKASDFTVGVRLARLPDGRVYVADVVRGQMEPATVERSIKAACVGDGESTSHSLPQDPGQAGKAQIAKLASVLAGHDFRFTLESGDKFTRAVPFAAEWNAGNVCAPASAPWRTSFEAEMTTFPNGRKDDQVDAASRAYTLLLQIDSESPTIGVPRVIR
jgi:predicted phage terminase large subunit-like protein